MLVLLGFLVVFFIFFALFSWAAWAIISAAVVGAVIGGLARLVLPGKQELGIFATIVIGWIGSLFGSILGHRVLHVGNVVTVLIEIGVAVVLVAIASGGVGNMAARRSSSLRF